MGKDYLFEVFEITEKTGSTIRKVKKTGVGWYLQDDFDLASVLTWKSEGIKFPITIEDESMMYLDSDVSIISYSWFLNVYRLIKQSLMEIESSDYEMLYHSRLEDLKYALSKLDEFKELLKGSSGMYVLVVVSC